MKPSVIVRKQKTPKLQQGGVAYGNVPGLNIYGEAPAYRPHQTIVPDMGQFETFKKEKVKIPELDTEALEKLAGKGHTNAVNLIIGQAKQSLAKVSDILYNDPFASDTVQVKSLLKKATVGPELINKLHRDLKLTEDAQKITEKNDAMSSYAVSSTGKMLVKDANDNIHEVGMDDYMKNKNKYQPVTNSEAYNYKDTNDNLTFKPISDYTTNTYGMKKIEDNMNGILSKLGTTASKGEREGIAQMAQFGAKGLQDQLGSSGVLGTVKQSGGNENNKTQLKSTLNYILEAMDAPTRNTLMAEAATKSKSPEEQQQRVYGLIADFVQRAAVNKSESSTTISPSQLLTKTGGGSGDEKGVPIGPLMQSMEGYATQQTIGMQKGAMKMTLTGSVYNYRKAGDADLPLEKTSLGQAVDLSKLNIAGTGTVLSNQMIRNAVPDPRQNPMTIYAPVDDKGKLLPDTEQKFAKYQKEVANLPKDIKGESLINAQYALAKQNGLDVNSLRPVMAIPILVGHEDPLFDFSGKRDSHGQQVVDDAINTGVMQEVKDKGDMEYYNTALRNRDKDDAKQFTPGVLSTGRIYETVVFGPLVNVSSASQIDKDSGRGVFQPNVDKHQQLNTDITVSGGTNSDESPVILNTNSSGFLK
jgi:hypothetical protein